MSSNVEKGCGRNRVVMKPVAVAAGALGLVQGIAWTIFSVLCICYYNGVLLVDPNATTFASIYNIFLNRVADSSPDILVRPQDFLIFMCFYVIFSIIWILLSGALIWGVLHDQWHWGKGGLGGWSTITICISVVDVILTSLIGHDYGARLSLSTSTSACLLSYGIVMSLSARGYVLWIVNLIFAILTLKFTIDMVLNDDTETMMPIIYGYETPDIDHSWLHNSINDLSPGSHLSTSQIETSINNNAFNRSRKSFVEGNSSVHGQILNYNNNLEITSPSSSFTEAIKTATIGRKELRLVPPQHVSVPVIPSPDYTPPSSPHTLKSALRSKTSFQ